MMTYIYWIKKSSSIKSPTMSSNTPMTSSQVNLKFSGSRDNMEATHLKGSKEDTNREEDTSREATGEANQTFRVSQTFEVIYPDLEILKTSATTS